MFGLMEKLATPSEFMPHGYCFAWDSKLLWLHIGSDIITGMAYFVIAGVMTYLLIRKRDTPFSLVFILFIIFIFACGTTHFMSVWTIYVPSFWVQGEVKAFNAIISLVTAIILIPLMPRILALPSLQKTLDKNTILNKALHNKVADLQDEIIKREKAEEALKRKQNHLEKAQDIGSIGTWELDIAKNKLFWTDENYKIFELPLGTPLTYETFLNRVHPDDREYVDEQWAAAKKGEPYDIDHRLMMDDGSVKWVREKAYLEFGKDGNCLKATGVTQDITKRKLAEMALLKSDETFKTLLESTVGSVGEEFFNKTAHRLNDWLGTDCLIIGELIGDNRVNAIATVLDGKNVVDYSYKLSGSPCENTTVNGFCLYPENIQKLFPADQDLTELRAEGYVGTPLVDSMGNTTGVLCALSHNRLDLPKRAKEVIEIIADRASAELERKKASMALVGLNAALEERVVERTNELDMANERLMELDKLKSLFIASMSHELRTPLNSIIGFTGVLLRGRAGELNEEQLRQLTIVKGSSKHLLGLIDDIIDVSKIEADKIELFIEEFDLAVQLTEIKDTFDLMIKGRELTLTIDAPPVLPVMSDERRVRQIIVNLVSNAIKFTNCGDVTIRACKNGDLVEVSVSDSGVGIRAEDIEKLFQPFSRIVQKDKIVEGSGLGLYLSQKIAALLGGEIRVESEFGKGSLFTLTLPLRYEEAQS